MFILLLLEVALVLLPTQLHTKAAALTPGLINIHKYSVVCTHTRPVDDREEDPRDCSDSQRMAFHYLPCLSKDRLGSRQIKDTNTHLLSRLLLPLLSPTKAKDTMTEPTGREVVPDKGIPVFALFLLFTC